MFTLLLIGMEIATLAGVFWFIYLRQERPHRIESTIWGKYENDSGEEAVLLLLTKDGVVIEADAPAKRSNTVPFPNGDSFDGKRSA